MDERDEIDAAALLDMRRQDDAGALYGAAMQLEAELRDMKAAYRELEREIAELRGQRDAAKARTRDVEADAKALRNVIQRGLGILEGEKS